MDRCLIAGVQSGCGKSSVALAMMQDARSRGVRVAPMKAGPDFLDPMWHAAVCARPGFNLDTRMMGTDHCRSLFDACARGCDVAIIEGVMGLFDGAAGVGGEGSSAHLAALLDLPVILTVSARGMSGSLVPLVDGFTRRAAAMGVRIAGVAANHVGSARHAAMLAELLARENLPPLVGWLEKDAPTLPERHLGLMPPGDAVRQGDLPDLAGAWHWMREEWRPDGGAARDGAGAMDAAAAVMRGARSLLAGRRVAVARDAAFCFLYPANIAWLCAQGAKLAFFSPLAGEGVPADADALWLPGGYPELHAARLAESGSLDSVRAFVESGVPVLAECGGMMVLGEAIETGGEIYRMAGVLPCRFVMQDRLVALGYREEAGGMRGHEFHHGERLPGAGGRAVAPAFRVARGDEGLRWKGLRASWIHWYFPSAPNRAAAWFGGADGG